VATTVSHVRLPRRTKTPSHKNGLATNRQAHAVDGSADLSSRSSAIFVGVESQGRKTLGYESHHAENTGVNLKVSTLPENDGFS